MFEIFYDQYNPKYEIIPLGHQGENEARCLIWDISEYIDEFQDGTVQVKVTQPDSDNEVVYWASNVTKVEWQAKWTLTDVDTASSGIGLCELYYYGPEGEVLAKSPLARFEITPTQGISGDVPDPYEDLLSQVSALASQAQSAASSATASAASAQTSASQAASAAEDMVDDEASIRAAQVASLQLEVASLKGAVGSPLVAPLASVMSDTTKIYVYTGSESGYTYGNWYYFNGSSWVSGGVYNSGAVNVDKTLSHDGAAADSAAVGTQLRAAFVTEQTSGSICSFDDGADDVPVNAFTVNIEAVQSGSGDPSPTNIRPITAFDSAKIEVVNKNLFDQNYINLNDGGVIRGLSITRHDDGSFTLNGTSTNTETTVTTITNSFLLKAGSYVFSGAYTTSATNPIYLRLRSKNNNTSTTIRSGDGSFTLDVDTMIDAVIYFRVQAEVDNMHFEPMIRMTSDTDTTYVPNKQNVYDISFGEAGTVYVGTLDVKAGMLTVNSVGKTFDGTENWSQQNTEPNRFFRYVFSGVKTDSIENMGRACSHFQNVGVISTSTDIGFYAYTSGSNNNIWFQFRPDLEAIPDLETWKTWVTGQYANGTPLQAFTPTTTPVSYQLTPTEVKTILGQNNIWTDCGDITNLEYRADTRLYINKLINS